MTTGALWCCGSRLSACPLPVASPAGRWGDRDVPKTRHGPALLRCYLRADLCLRAENNGVDLMTFNQWAASRRPSDELKLSLLAIWNGLDGKGTPEKLRLFDDLMDGIRTECKEAVEDAREDWEDGF